MARTDISVCTLSGNVVADPDESSYGDGKKGCRLRLAVNDYGEKTAWLFVQRVQRAGQEGHPAVRQEEPHGRPAPRSRRATRTTCTTRRASRSTVRTSRSSSAT